MKLSKNAFELSFIIGLIIMIITLAWAIITYSLTYEKHLLSLFAKSELFINESEITLSDSIVNSKNVRLFYRNGMNEELPYGTIVVLNGKVSAQGLSIGSRPFIGLTISEYNGFGCFFDTEYTSYVLEKIKKGENIRIRGKYRGTMYGNIIFADCSIIK